MKYANFARCTCWLVGSFIWQDPIVCHIWDMSARAQDAPFFPGVDGLRSHLTKLQHLNLAKFPGRWLVMVSCCRSLLSYFYCSIAFSIGPIGFLLIPFRLTVLLQTYRWDMMSQSLPWALSSHSDSAWQECPGLVERPRRAEESAKCRCCSCSFTGNGGCSLLWRTVQGMSWHAGGWMCILVLSRFCLHVKPGSNNVDEIEVHSVFWEGQIPTDLSIWNTPKISEDHRSIISYMSNSHCNCSILFCPVRFRKSGCLVLHPAGPTGRRLAMLFFSTECQWGKMPLKRVRAWWSSGLNCWQLRVGQGWGTVWQYGWPKSGTLDARRKK